MPRVRLTARNVGSFEAPPRGAPPIDYFDEAEGAVPWFCLRVSSEGRPTFTVGYRVGRRRRRLRLGRFPTTSLAEARQRARTVLAEVTRGHDLRSTCATGCSRLGAAESTVSRILGHAGIAGTVPVTARYDRFAHLPERAAALSAWAAHVNAMVASSSTGRSQRSNGFLP